VHAYWCVFLPESVVFVWESTVKYWCGLRLESKQTLVRGMTVVKVIWSLVSLAIFSVMYSFLFVYEAVLGHVLLPVRV
jgi:hypothetical protein